MYMYEKQCHMNWDFFKCGFTLTKQITHYSNAHLMTSNSITNVVAKIKARLQLTNADANEVNRRRKNCKGKRKNEAKPPFKTLRDLDIDF